MELHITRRTGLSARGESPAAFDRRCIPLRIVVHRSNTAGIFPLLALLSGRIADLGATRGFTTDCYVPFDKAGADLLFGFISQRYERRSLVVTTNLPFARWSEVFLDATAAAAVIDRIVHHATVLTAAGDSYRLKVATRNQASRATQEVPRQ